MATPRVLLVDDNPELLELLASLLQESGYQVLRASRGRQALDIARSERPDLVVIDMLLPDLMGQDVADFLRRMKTKFFFMSGVYKGGSIGKDTQAKYGALAYFEKPFESATLLEAVKKAVPPPAAGPAAAKDFEVETDIDVDVQEDEISGELTGRIRVHAANHLDAELKGDALKAHTLKPGSAALVRKAQAPVAAAAAAGNPTPAPAAPAAPARAPSRPPGPAPAPGPPPGATAAAPKTGPAKSGVLKDNLPALITAFFTARESGELGLERGKVKKVVYFDQGFPVFALSNLVSDRFGQFLVRVGKIDDAALRAAVSSAERTHKRTGDVLIEMGLLSETERLFYIAQQVKAILYSLFTFEEGTYHLSFQARARKEAIKLDVHPANLIMRGVKKLYKPSRLQRLVAKTDRLIPSADPAYLLSDVQLDAWEAQLMPKIDGNRTVEELVKISRKAPEIVWALMVGLLSLRIMEKRT